MESTRLLLIEFHFPDRYSQFRTKNYPFMLGQARQLGLKAKWLCCYTPTEKTSSERYFIELDAAASGRLMHAIRAFEPTHLVLSEKLNEPLAHELSLACPEAKIEDLSNLAPADLVAWPTSWLPAFVGLDQAPADDGQVLIMDSSQPIYGCEAVNKQAHQAGPPVHVTAGVDCAYRRKLSKNKYFKNVEPGPDARSFGCSFCVGPVQQAYLFQSDPVELALKQCLAALKTDESCIAKDTFVMNGAQLFNSLQAFFEGILEQAFPPSRFFFSCRIDEFLGAVAAMEAVLPQLQEAGHSINIFNMGVENFSQVENDRLNKGLSSELMERADRETRRLEEAFPEAFSFSKLGGYGLIIFTPWTTEEDLSINLAAMRRFDGIDAEGFALSSKLQILAESAIRSLAERDGLLTDSFEDFHYYDSGCMFRHDQREMPWRFKHPKVEWLYGIACRIVPLTSFGDDDALANRVKELYADVKKRAWTPVDLLEAAIKASAETSAAKGPGDILDQLVAELPKEWLSAQDRSAGPESKSDGRMAALSAGPPSAAVARADQILALLGAQKDVLAGFEPLESGERSEPNGQKQLVITLSRADERLVLHLLPNEPGRPAFLATDRFLVRYNEQTPVDSADKEKAAWMIAAHMERFALMPGVAQQPAKGPLKQLNLADVVQLVRRAPGREEHEE